MSDKSSSVIEATKAWVDSFVVALNLCPFAKHPLDKGRVRFVEYLGDDLAALTQTLLDEMELLDSSDALETTLLVAPKMLHDFDEYLDYLSGVETLMDELGYTGTYQIAGFHPDYRFEGVAPFDPANYTNRSPYPMLHIIREASVEWAIETHPDVDAIPERNVELLREMGEAGIKDLLCGKR